jgi:predicted RNA-binding protein with PIN domain
MVYYRPMHEKIYILDGYNLIHRIPRWRSQLDISLERGREALLAYCRRWMQQRGDVWLFCVIFDGSGDVPIPGGSAGPGVRIIYSSNGKNADDTILDIVREFGETHDYTVVSDDNYVRRGVVREQADFLSTTDFAAVLDRTTSRPAGSKTRGNQTGNQSDDDARKVAPAAAKAITESLMREWNV